MQKLISARPLVKPNCRHIWYLAQVSLDFSRQFLKVSICICFGFNFFFFCWHGIQIPIPLDSNYVRTAQVRTKCLILMKVNLTIYSFVPNTQQQFVDWFQASEIEWINWEPASTLSTVAVRPVADMTAIGLCHTHSLKAIEDSPNDAY